MKVLGHSGMGSMDAVAHAVTHSVEAKCDIVCMSLGSPRANSQVHDAIRHATSHGVIVVCAAGNDGGAVNYPAAFSETIGVGAVDKDGNVCEFSSRGKEITVAAPGKDITSTWLDNGYATISGTSMAAPFVAGVLCLYVSAAKKDGQKISHSSVLKALEETCRDVNAPGRCDDYGWGLVDPHKLLSFAAPPAGVTIYIPGAKIL
jgi:subtilisin family serine protease